ncbi:MAG: hypothetical protein AB1750_10500 [Chloroflexota bacterium]
MEPKPKVSPDMGGIGRCPHLGLHDDPATSLAYPSNWNYCYRAKPPASILNSHQAEACLGAGYQQCPVFLRAEAGSMPSHLRGTNTLPVSAHRASRRAAGLVWSAIVIALLAAAAVIVPRYVPLAELFPSPTITPTQPTFTPRPTSTETPTRVYLDPNVGIIASFTAEAQTRIANYTATLNPTDLAGSQTAARAASLTPPTITPSKTKTPSPTRTPSPTKTPSRTPTPLPSPLPSRTPTLFPTPSSDMVCGHALDTPFGGERKFVIHRVETGENLTVFADAYQTTTEAIIAINYHLPLPVWADWVVVIPVGFSDVSGVPPFEPYLATDERMTIEAMAAQLNTDVELFRKFNAFTEPCGVFSGWLLIPRPAAAP